MPDAFCANAIGPRLRRVRRSRGLSLDVVAGLAGISKPYLSRLERGQRRLDSLELLGLLAAALEVPVEHLTKPDTSRVTTAPGRARGTYDAADPMGARKGAATAAPGPGVDITYDRLRRALLIVLDGAGFHAEAAAPPGNS